MKYLLLFIYCFFATGFFALLLRVPKRFLVWCSLNGAGGYLFYTLAHAWLPETSLCYFSATLFMVLASEILARQLKTLSTIFVTTALIPLVPGLGLYRTMRALVENDLGAAASEGTATMIAILAMAAALAVGPFLVRLFVKRSAYARPEALSRGDSQSS